MRSTILLSTLVLSLHLSQQGGRPNHIRPRRVDPPIRRTTHSLVLDDMSYQSPYHSRSDLSPSISPRRVYSAYLGYLATTATEVYTEALNPHRHMEQHSPKASSPCHLATQTTSHHDDRRSWGRKSFRLSKSYPHTPLQKRLKKERSQPRI
jgi:hypothetical protein